MVILRLAGILPVKHIHHFERRTHDLRPDARVERVLATRGWVVSEGNYHTRTWEREDGHHVVIIPLRDGEVGYHELVAKAVKTLCVVLGAEKAASALGIPTDSGMTPKIITTALFEDPTVQETASIG